MKTKKYSRLPPEPGIPFTGFEFAEIESRKPVAKDIQDFIDYCVRDARSPAARIILGEWGEGKSEAYFRYIVPAVMEKRGFAYDVSAPSIIETYKTPLKNTKIKTTSSLSVQFLTAIFWSLFDDLRVKAIATDKIPSIADFADPIEWLQEILHNHADSGSLKLFIFIDQIEELILEHEVLKWFLTGLRETLDGKFFPISEKGLYPGSIFFFLSCTPDAYNRMRVDPHIDQIFGGQRRRIDSILLNPIGQIEGTKFFHDLLRYSYAGTLPNQLPFMSAGTLTSLYTATRGNLGAMVSLFTRIMSKIPSSEDEMDVIDGIFITDLLSNEEISIYGGVNRCIEKELLNRIETNLQKSKSSAISINLFKTLVGEYKPFSVQEIAGRFNLSIAEVHRHINLINQALSNIVPNAIVRIFPLKDGVTFNNIIEKLRLLQWIDVDDSGQQIIHVDNYTEKITELQDRLSFPEFLPNGEMIQKVYVPYDIEAIKISLEGMSEESTHKFQKAIEKLIDENARCFIISENIVNRLYPIPVSPWLQFIKNRDLRLRLWRDVRANFHIYFTNEMSDAFVETISHAGSLQVPSIRECSIKKVRYVDIYEMNSKVTIRTVIVPMPYIDLDGLREILKEIRSLNPRPNLILVLHSEDLPEYITSKTKEFDERILLLKLHPTYAKNLLAIYIATRDYFEHVDKLQLEIVLNNLANQIKISERVTDWIEEGRRSGMVLTDLIKNNANDDKELVDALKFYINFTSIRGSPEEIYELNLNKLLRFVPFGLRLGFVADIETKEQFKNITQDLKNNGFVAETLDGKIEVTSHPVEKRLFNILKEKKEIDIKFLEEFFVLSAAARKILPNVYLSVLEHKGLIETFKDRVVLRDEKEYLAEVEKKYVTYRSAVDALLPMWKDYAHVYVTKQRAPRLVMLKDFHNTIIEVHDSIEKALNEQTKLQIMYLLETIIDHFDENLRPKIEGAVQKSASIINSVDAKFNEFKQKLSDLIHGYNTLVNANLNLDDIRENLTVVKGKKEINEFCSTELGEDKLLQCVEELPKELFDFRHYRQEDQLFNIKLSYIEAQVKNFIDDVDRKLQQIDSISKMLSDIKSKEKDLESKIITFMIEEKCKIAFRLFSLLQASFTQKEKIAEKSEQITSEEKVILKFSDIEKDLKKIESRYIERESSLSSLVESLKEIHSVESEYMKKKEEVESQLSTFISNVDIQPYVQINHELKESFENVMSNYEGVLNSLSQYQMEGRSLRKLRKQLEDIIDILDRCQGSMRNVWNDFKNRIKERMETTIEVFNILKMQGQKVDEVKFSKLDERIKSLFDLIKSISPWIGEVKLSEIENEVMNILNEASEILANVLSPEERVVLQNIVEEKRISGKDWIIFDELVKKIEAKNISIDISQTVQKLIDKKILVQGISFTAR